MSKEVITLEPPSFWKLARSRLEAILIAGRRCCERGSRRELTEAKVISGLMGWRVSEGGVAYLESFVFFCL